MIAALLSIVVAAALWWAYFDVVAIVAARHLSEATGVAQVSMARDSYSYIHLAMIAGIVLLALGSKETIAGVDEPLALLPAFALCGGVAIYLLGHIAFRLRNVRTLNRQRLVVAIACLGLVPLTRDMDALLVLVALTVLCTGLIAYEVLRFREARARVRAAA